MKKQALIDELKAAAKNFNITPFAVRDALALEGNDSPYDTECSHWEANVCRISAELADLGDPIDGIPQDCFEMRNITTADEPTEDDVFEGWARIIDIIENYIAAHDNE